MYFEFEMSRTFGKLNFGKLQIKINMSIPNIFNNILALYITSNKKKQNQLFAVSRTLQDRQEPSVKTLRSPFSAESKILIFNIMCLQPYKYFFIFLNTESSRSSGRVG